MVHNSKSLDYSTKNTEIKQFYISLYWMIMTFVVGLYIVFVIGKAGINKPTYYGSPFSYLYVRNETLMFGLLFIALLLLRCYMASDKLFFRVSIVEQENHLKVKWIWIIALSLLLICWLGDFFVMHGFPVSNDEYLSRFQAKIFISGRIKVVLDPIWREFAEALTPPFVIFDPKANTWVSGYLPVYAAIRTAFLALGCESLTSPVLAALSIIFIAQVARKLWPKDKFAPFLAVVLLGSSTQFLITSMTSYAYPAHLCFNLAWLSCYLRDDRLGVTVTPWIGFFALGLHNPFTHALFVIPFLFSTVRKRNWKVILYFAVVYLAGCVVWYFWMRFTRPSMVNGEDLRIFQFPEFYQLLIQPMNLSLLFSWQSLATSILFIVALRHWTTMNPLLKQLLWGCALTFSFYFFFPWDQVLGWGYRFFYGVLGNLVLVAVSGWFLLYKALGRKKILGFLLLATILALFIQFPIRCYQVESFVRPLVVSAQFLQSRPQPFIVLDIKKIYLSVLLVRNEPFLRNNPKIFFSMLLTKEQKVNLEKLGHVREIQPTELAPFGLYPINTKPVD